MTCLSKSNDHSVFGEEDSEPYDIRIEIAESLTRDLQTESSSIHGSTRYVSC